MTDTISANLQNIVSTMHIGLLAPHLIVSLGGIFLMFISLIKKGAFKINTFLTIIILALAASFAFYSGSESHLELQAGFNGMIVSDLFSNTAILIYCFIGILTVLISHNYLERRQTNVPEYYVLLLFAIAGMMFMTSAADLMILFLGLEILSVSLFVMAGIDIKDLRSTEAGIKYFLLSVFASAFLLFGIAFVYGATGSTEFSVVKDYALSNSFAKSHYLYAGVLLILAGMAFKISVVPFHMWTPDVYQGAPISVTAFLSTGPKVASFAFLFKFIYQFQNVQPYPELLQDIIVAVAVLTMIVGNLLALNQEDIKRMLAYSSITHMGYVMTAFASRSDAAISAALFYFSAYVFMNLGIFGILAVISRNNDKNLTIANFKGMAQKKPGMAFLFMIFLFSLAGIPPLIGFAAKFFVFSAVIKSGMYGLAVIGILNSAVSAYYYLRVVINMYLKPSEEGHGFDFVTLKFGVTEIVAITGCIVAVIILGLQPASLVQFFDKIVL